MISQKTHRF